MLLSEMSDDQVRRVLQGVRMDIHEKRSVASAAHALVLGEIPMIARLLAELGVNVEGLQPGDSGVVTRTIGTLTGTFYVEDAPTALDDMGRPIIGARDFVEREGVKTVFGCGGAYLLEQSFAVVVVFLSERVPRLLAERLGSLGSGFKTATMRLMAEKRIFGLSPDGAD